MTPTNVIIIHFQIACWCNQTNSNPASKHHHATIALGLYSVLRDLGFTPDEIEKFEDEARKMNNCPQVKKIPGEILHDYFQP